MKWFLLPSSPSLPSSVSLPRSKTSVHESHISVHLHFLLGLYSYIFLNVFPFDFIRMINNVNFVRRSVLCVWKGSPSGPDVERTRCTAVQDRSPSTIRTGMIFVNYFFFYSICVCKREREILPPRSEIGWERVMTPEREWVFDIYSYFYSEIQLGNTDCEFN